MAQKKRFDYNYLGHTGLKVSEICLGKCALLGSCPFANNVLIAELIIDYEI